MDYTVSLEQRMAARKKALAEKKLKAQMTKFNRAVKTGNRVYAEILAHEIGIPHDCELESTQIAWSACVRENDGDRQAAEQEFAM
jgi:hypothetical protein